jgi:hypothetical protein
MVWATELPRAGCGNAATAIVASPPPTSIIRPARRPARSPNPETT